MILWLAFTTVLLRQATPIAVFATQSNSGAFHYSIHANNENSYQVENGTCFYWSRNNHRYIGCPYTLQTRRKTDGSLNVVWTITQTHKSRIRVIVKSSLSSTVIHIYYDQIVKDKA